MFINKILSMRIKYWLRKNKTTRSTTAYSNVVSVGVVFCILEETLLININSFIHKLQKDNKQVTVLAYLPNNMEQYNYPYNYFTPENISFWGRFKNSEATNFMHQSFDYLLHLDDKQSTVVRGILAQSNAKCRIGKYANTSNPYYELMINSQKKDYLQEMYNYISILN